MAGGAFLRTATISAPTVSGAGASRLVSCGGRAAFAAMAEEMIAWADAIARIAGGTMGGRPCHSSTSGAGVSDGARQFVPCVERYHPVQPTPTSE